jgi:hypothetical protein
MTTAYAHAVRGHFLTAFKVQPFGGLLAVLTIAAGVLAAMALYTGRAWWINWYRLSPSLVATAGLVAFLAAWAYKIITIRGWPGS